MFGRCDACGELDDIREIGGFFLCDGCNIYDTQTALKMTI
jgi:hypothetical protein